MAATIKDIAVETGLGLATISSYINGGNVREKNRQKIEDAIRKLHYEVNETARGLKTNRTKTVGVVIPELNNTFCAEILTSMEDVLRRHGYATIICDCRTDSVLEGEAIDFLYKKRVDGIINMPVDVSGSNLRIFEKAKKPIILIDRKIMNLSCNSVFVDNPDAAKKAVGKLLAAGHTKIGIITGPEGVFTADERLAGYGKALKKEGLRMQDRFIFRGDYTMQSGIEGMKALVSRNPDMTAVFVTNYEMTLGAVIALNELRMKMPEDISLIGFDNLSFARACSPALTIVVQPTAEIGQRAAEMLLKHLSGQDGEVKDGDAENAFLRHDCSLKTRIEEGASVRTLKKRKG